MKPLHVSVLAVLALALGAQNASASEAPAASDPAMEQLGIPMDQARDLCSYVKDVEYGGDNKYSWQEACGAAAPDIAKLRHLKDMDFIYRYGAALAAAPERKKVVLEAQEAFGSGELAEVKVDS
ncbi:MAG: hypothetical protein WC943_13945, partial [Elusimicrobiota bacterium]